MSLARKPFSCGQRFIMYWEANHSVGSGSSCSMSRVASLTIKTTIPTCFLSFITYCTGKKHPIYGTQWHPEKMQFEWEPKEDISHSPDAIPVGQYMANFFVKQGTPAYLKPFNLRSLRNLQNVELWFKQLAVKNVLGLCLKQATKKSHRKHLFTQLIKQVSRTW